MNCRLLITANRTTDYYLWVFSSTASTVTVSTDFAPVPKYPMTKFTLPYRAKSKAKFTVSVNVTPNYGSFTSPIRFYIQKRNSAGRFKAYKYVNAGITGDNPSFTRFGVRTSLSKRGTYRVRARFNDVNHSSKYTAWKTIRIK